MLKTSHFLKCLLLISSIVFFSPFTGCEKPPTDKLIRAEKAIDEAKQREADLYAGDVVLQAEQALQKAKDFVAVKKYAEAKKVADDAVQLAKEASFLTEHNKTKIKTEAEQIIKEVELTLDEIKSLSAEAMNKKTKFKKTKANFHEIQEMIGKWETELQNIKNDLQAQKILQASNALKALQEQISIQKKIIITSLTTTRRKK